MSVSLVYRSTIIYRAAMLGLYGRHLDGRYRAISDLIPDRASVLELCCGPACLYWRHLRNRAIEYRGLDLNPRFVQKLARRGAQAEVRDLRSADPLPGADYVLMQAGLYQFLPDPSPLVNRMLAAGRRQVIVSEPVRNLASSGMPIISALARRHTDAGAGRQAHRFTEQTLDAFFSQYAPQMRSAFLIAAGREKVYVLSSNGNP